MLVVDNFAGGGGASLGIESALGRPVDFAINHDATAIAMHRLNHPHTKHLITSVWDVNPRKLCAGRPVSLGWFSPDCTFHSKAKGSKPFRERDVARRRRGLAGLIPRWMEAVRPQVVMLENVEEFADWGPLIPNGSGAWIPDPKRRGLHFRRWHRQIERLGYQIDMREMRACDYGAPTTRKRLFIIARCDGQEIVFPEATHGPWIGAHPYRTAAECIDWTAPCPSIFERSRPLKDATMRRIARGVMRFVVNARQPFIVPLTHSGDLRVHAIDGPLPTITTANGGELALVVPTLINTRNGERVGQAPRVRDIRDPFPTVTAHGSQGALVAAFLARHYGGHENAGSSLSAPMHTITSRDHHALVSAFLVKYYGTGATGSRMDEPMHTVRTTDTFGLVMVRGERYRIVDIGMRMLTPRELYRAQSFPDSYRIDPLLDGKPLSKAGQIRMCGNSVAPVAAEALVRANVIEQLEREVA